MEVIVTDHHQRDEELPSCLILHPEVSNYPFTSLCGTAVAWKLACALREGARRLDDARSAAAERDLDLVALATVADVVPLIGENRSLVKRGLAEMRRTKRVGLQGADGGFEMRADSTRRGGPGVPARAADQCGGAAVSGRRRGRAAAHRGRGAGQADRRRAGTGELRATGDRARGRCGGGDGAAGAARRAEGSQRAGASRARDGTPAWSGSSPRGWSSGTTDPSSSSRSTGRGEGAARAAASPASICTRRSRRAPSTWRPSAATRPPPGCRSRPRTWRRSAPPSPLTPNEVLATGGPEADRADRRDGRWGGARPRPRRRARAAGSVRDGQSRACG